MTPEYKSELQGKRRGLIEIRDRLTSEIRQLDEILGEGEVATIPLRGKIA